MSTSSLIHPYLLARLIAVQDAFNHPGSRPVKIASATMNPDSAKRGNNWKDVIKDEDEDEEGGGGRGTMKGLRGKNAAAVKAAMRKLTRNR